MEVHCTFDRGRLFSICFILISVIAIAPTTALAVIYGDDDRQDVYEVSNPAMLLAAQATAMLIPRDQLQFDQTTGEYEILLSQDLSDLCADEKFIDQPTAAPFCSGTVVGSDLIVTADFCLTALDVLKSLDNVAVVFGFYMKGASEYSSRLDANDVYFLKEEVARVNTPYESIPVLRVNRPFVGHESLPIRPPEESLDEFFMPDVFSAAYMEGIPLKLTGDSYSYQDRTATEGYWYLGYWLDVLAGSAGAPVFSLQYDNSFQFVEGIVAYGPPDYTWTPDGCIARMVLPYGEKPGIEGGEQAIVLSSIYEIVTGNIVLAGCDTLVKDRLLDGMMLSDQFAQCDSLIGTERDYKKCIKSLAREFKQAGAITSGEIKLIGACW